MQREIPILAEMQRPTRADEHLVSRAGDLLGAVQMCVQLSGLSNEAICERMGIDPGHWTRMMQGRASLQLRKLPALMRICGNLAPLQWLASEMGFDLYEDAKAKRKAELLAELASMEKVA
jgi:transcriptional regulator with XRE-family HTH domain